MRGPVAALASLAWLATLGVSAAPIQRGATNKSPFYVPNRWPTIPFEVPESWSGLLPFPAAHRKETLEYFFWYFESEAAKGKDDLVVWLNGGPGTSNPL